jgi:GMP synthase (glutamine-hydrolysing)
MLDKVRYLLLQVRNDDDPIVAQEIRCFARALRTSNERISTSSMLKTAPTAAQLASADVVLLGGSGHYSATGEAPWLSRTFDVLRELHAVAKPTFASCWGFQAFARALGGQVVHDLSRAEIGTLDVSLTEAGQSDPVFGPLGATFKGQMGHEDRISRLPPGATRLASTQLVDNQAYRFDGKAMYCTQFHPELNRDDILVRVRAYPSYVERIAGVSLEEFEARCIDTPQTEALLPRFVETVLA